MTQGLLHPVVLREREGEGKGKGEGGRRER